MCSLCVFIALFLSPPFFSMLSLDCFCSVISGQNLANREADFEVTKAHAEAADKKVEDTDKKVEDAIGKWTNAEEEGPVKDTYFSRMNVAIDDNNSARKDRDSARKDRDAAQKSLAITKKIIHHCVDRNEQFSRPTPAPAETVYRSNLIF